ncbi:MAG: hypothetical protein HY885_08430 [Deltaproteobacteria bacterium]|nr:hypothetical protein [Deltaproteobacteria bacterium]
MKKISLLYLALLLIPSVAQPVAAEEQLTWVVLENLPDGRSYNYSPNSLKTIEGGIKEVYDGVVGSHAKDVRQLRVDCTLKKWAIGETKSWRNEKPVDSPNLGKDGWVWHPVEGNLNADLVGIVCGK